MAMVQVIVPTRNAAKSWSRFAPALLACVAPEQVLIVDSGSTDNTCELARAAGFKVRSSAEAEFDHGGTRQIADDELPEAELLVYLAQDAVLAGPKTLTRLLKAFRDAQVGAAFGRQLPRPGAGTIEAFECDFAYPAVSDVRSLASRERLGIGTIFLSNAFAAYRRSALMEVGGFPAGSICAPETIVAAELLLRGWKVAYVAKARVFHSHASSGIQELRRCFDLGVLHSRENWLLDGFGSPDKEARRLAVSELKFLWEQDAGRILEALFRTGMKAVGYGLGSAESRLRPGVKRRLSLRPEFWEE